MRISFFEPVRYRIRTVQTLPPAGIPGDCIVINLGGVFQTYVWNQVTNQWVQIINNNYTVGPSGPDVNGPVTFTNFADENLWTRVYNANFGLAFAAGGATTISYLGPAVAAQGYGFGGVVSRKLILPNSAGLIDISFNFTGCNFSAPAASKDRAAVCLLTSNGIYAVGMGGAANNVWGNGFYVSFGCNDLRTNSLSQFGTSSGAMGTAINNFTLRGQYRWLAAPANLFPMKLDNPAVAYQHNGAGAVAFGGAQDATYYLGNNFSQGGFRVMLGMFNINQPAAAYNATLSSFTLHAGRFIGA